MRVWSYVITYDGGSAPNYEGPAVTLAVCKPRIRKRAKAGDLVLGFNGRTLSSNPHSVRWAGVVSEVIPLEDYWEDARFRPKRPEFSKVADNIYSLEGEYIRQVVNDTHDDGNVENDLSGRNALIFSKAWYFGDSAPELPEQFDLRVTANRRLEPQRQISDYEWDDLRDWMDLYEIGLASAPKGGSGRGKPPEDGVIAHRSATCR